MSFHYGSCRDVGCRDVPAEQAVVLLITRVTDEKNMYRMLMNEQMDDGWMDEDGSMRMLRMEEELMGDEYMRMEGRWVVWIDDIG